MPIETIRRGTLEYLADTRIPVPHAFTTRLGGVSTGSLSSLNLGIHRGDSRENVMENYRILADALGFSTENLVLTHQIHTDIIRKVGQQDCRPGDLFGAWQDCDGLITDTPGLALAIFTADCTPILLYDPDTGAVGAAHAGWRGTAQDIAGKTALAMAQAFGSRPERLIAAIGPNIGPCCFETDGEVPRAMAECYGTAAQAWIRPQGNKYYVNLKELNALSLRRVGVARISVSPVCTACENRRFWSHRITGGNRGSQGALIVCKGGGS